MLEQENRDRTIAAFILKHHTGEFTTMQLVHDSRQLDRRPHSRGVIPHIPTCRTGWHNQLHHLMEIGWVTRRQAPDQQANSGRRLQYWRLTERGVAEAQRGGSIKVSPFHQETNFCC